MKPCLLRNNNKFVWFFLKRPLKIMSTFPAIRKRLELACYD